MSEAGKPPVTRAKCACSCGSSERPRRSTQSKLLLVGNICAGLRHVHFKVCVGLSAASWARFGPRLYLLLNQPQRTQQ